MIFALEELLTSLTSLELLTMTLGWIRKRSWKKVGAAGSPHPKYLHSPKWLKSRSALSRKLGRIYGASAYPRRVGLSRQYDDSDISRVSTRPTSRNEQTLDENPFMTPTPPARRPLSLLAPSPRWSSRSAPALLENNLESVSKRSQGRKREKGDKNSSQDVDDKIAEVLLNKLSKTELEDKVGNNYLFEVVPADDTEKVVVKIGHTTMSELRRMKAISSRCKHFSMEREADPEGGPIYLYRKAEKLMQAELYDCTYYFTCACGAAHREYFDVDKTRAQEVIRRWRAFCELEPYDSNGELRPFWQRRLRERNKLRGGHQGLSEQEQRRMRWNRFTNPTRPEELFFNIAYVWALVCRLEWEDVAYIEALAIAILTYPSKLAFGWVWIILICFLIDKWSKMDLMGRFVK